MSTFDFRILLESVEGRKFSYYSSSFVNTDDNLVLSSSQVYNRITGSVSCSYQNKSIFTGDVLPTTSASIYFKNNTILSSSLSGSAESGSIVFQQPNNIDYDRLLRYKFMGSEKVCNVLGLPSETWVYVDQMRLPVDDESNYIEGNIKAKNIYVEDTITFANTSTFNSDLPILINTGSDRYIKFIDTRGTPQNALLMGYDKENDKYEIEAASNFTFDISGVDTAYMDTGSIINLDMTWDSSDQLKRIFRFGCNDLLEKIIQMSWITSAAYLELPHNSRIQITGSVPQWGSKQSFLSIGIDADDGLLFRSNRGSATPALIISGGNSGFGVSAGSITEKVQVNGNILASGTIYADAIEVTHFTSSFITSSTIVTEGSNIFGDTINDTHKFNGHITASGNISASGDLFADDITATDMVQGGRLSSTGNTTFGNSTDDTHTFTGHITASGNISASRAVYAKHLILSGGTDVFTSASLAAGGGGGSGTITALNNQTANRLVTIGSTTTELDGEANLTYDGTTFTVNDTMQVSSGDLTVGGNISSSGDLYIQSDEYIYFGNEAGASTVCSIRENSGNLYLDANDTLTVDVDNDVNFRGDGTQFVRFFGDEQTTRLGGTSTTAPTSTLEVLGDISASGDLYLDGTDGIYWTNDANMAIKRVSDDNIGIYCDDAIHYRVIINDAYVGINDTAQDVNFSHTSDVSTSDYNIFSDAGNAKVGIGTGKPTKKLQVEGDISASGDFVLGSLGDSSGYVSASLGGMEISGSGLGLSVGDWTDGYHGNDSFIPILPIDFTTTYVGRDYILQDDGGYGAPSHALTQPIAQKVIPRGFTATHVDMYGPNNEDFDVYKGEIDNDTTPQVDGGSCVMNTQCTLTEPVSGSDGTQYLTIFMEGIDHASDTIYGGKITITRTT